MRFFVAPLTALFVAFPATAAESGDDWPYPQDIPSIEPVSVGLAGESPADVTRYLMVRGASNQQLSPDGKTLAYISTVTGVPQVWLADVAGGQHRQLTVGNGVTFYRWAPDGKTILYGADNNGDEREAFYLISVNGQKEKQVLPFSDGFRRFGDFAPDGKRIVYASTERNGRDFDIWVADLESGKTRLVYEGTFGFFPVSWQPKFDMKEGVQAGDIVIVSETRGEDGNNVHFLNIKTGKMKPVFVPEVSAEYSSFTWHWSGDYFFFATNEDREHTALARFDIHNGQTTIIEAPDADIDQVRLCGGARYLAWTVNDGGYSRLYVHDFQEKRRATTPYLPDGVYNLDWMRQADSILSILINGPGTPGEVWVWKVSKGELAKVVSADMAGLPRGRMAVPEAIEMPARDGVTLQGLLYLPRVDDEKAKTKPPVVVRVHGGPTSQARPVFNAGVQYLVNKGIAVMDVNVRGSTGFGKTYARLDNQEKRLDSVRDLVDVLAALKTDGRVDAGRAAVMGGSYGGYMVNAVMGSYPEAFVAGASFVGVSDWVRALREAGPALKASDRIEYGDIREPEWQDFYAANSPINNAHKITAPMFFEHGVNDPRDPVTETDRMVRTLHDKGAEVEYLRFPDEGHSVRKLSNRVTMYRRLARFLEKHLGDGE